MILIGLAVTMTIVTLLAAAQAIDFGFFDLRLHWLDADYRLSVFGVASILAQVSAGTVSAWRSRRSDRHRLAWLILAALIASLVAMRALTAYSASELAGPLVCVFALICWLTWADSPPSRLVSWAGLGVLAISLLLHQVGADADAVFASNYTWHYQILGIVKHGAELAGWTLLAVAILAAIVPRPAPSATTGERPTGT